MMGMRAIWIIPVIVSILFIGSLVLPQTYAVDFVTILDGNCLTAEGAPEGTMHVRLLGPQQGNTAFFFGDSQWLTGTRNLNGGFCSFPLLLPGEYQWVAFSNPLTGGVPNPDNIIEFSQSVTVEEPPPETTIKITKNATNADGAFSFTIFNSTDPTNSTVVSIPNTAISNMTTPLTLKFGNYSITETVPLNWNLINASCGVAGEFFINPTISNVSLNVGNEIECVFENSLDPDAIEEQQKAIEEAQKAQEEADETQQEACEEIQEEIDKLTEEGIPVPAELQQIFDDNCT